MKLLACIKEDKNKIFQAQLLTYMKGVGEGRGGGGSGGLCPRSFKSWVHKWVCAPPPPILDRSSVLISPLALFLVKNAKFSWLASIANLTLFIFSKLG